MVGSREGRDNEGLLEGGQGCCFNFSGPPVGLEGSEARFPISNEEHTDAQGQVGQRCVWGRS